MGRRANGCQVYKGKRRRGGKGGVGGDVGRGERGGKVTGGTWGEREGS